MVELSIVSELLQQLLRHHDRVSLPDLGAFMVDYTSASLVEGGRAVLPPSQRISFQPSETWNDELLEYELAKHKNYTIEEARDQMRHFTQGVAEQLHAGHCVEFPGLGILRVTADNEWCFDPVKSFDVSKDSYGLLELEMAPLDSAPKTDSYLQPMQPLKPLSVNFDSFDTTDAPPLKRRHRGVICWIVFILLLLSAGVYIFREPLLNYIESISYTPEELAYLREQEQSVEEIIPEPEPVVEIQREQAQVKESKPVKTGKSIGHPSRRHNAFHVMLAQFGDEKSASAYAKRIKANEGYAAIVLNAGGDKPYKVSILRYASKKEAEEILEGLKKTDSIEFNNAWIEKY